MGYLRKVLCVCVCVFWFLFLNRKKLNYWKGNILIGKKIITVVFYDPWSYFQTYFCNKIMCVRLCQTSAWSRRKSYIRKIKQNKKSPPKPNLFLDCLIKMLFEDRIYISYNSSNKVRKKKIEKNKYIFKKVSAWHTVAVYSQYFNIYFSQTFKCELLLQDVCLSFYLPSYLWAQNNIFMLIKKWIFTSEMTEPLLCIM